MTKTIFQLLCKKDLDKAFADRAQWRTDVRRWCREGKLPQPGWWPGRKDEGGGMLAHNGTEPVLIEDGERFIVRLWK